MVDIDKMPAGAELDALVAKRLFGWRWMSYVGVPIKGTPGYPKKCRVRDFMSPKRMADDRWQAMLRDNESRPATGDEPLAYHYCSSQGPWPHGAYSTEWAAAMEAVERVATEYGYHVDVRAHAGLILGMSPSFECAVSDWRAAAEEELREGTTKGWKERAWMLADTGPLAICRAALKAVEKGGNRGN